MQKLNLVSQFLSVKKSWEIPFQPISLPSLRSELKILPIKHRISILLLCAAVLCDRGHPVLGRDTKNFQCFLINHSEAFLWRSPGRDSNGMVCWYAVFFTSFFWTVTCLHYFFPDRRNSLGGDVLFVGKHHPLCDFIVEQYKSKNTEVGYICSYGTVQMIGVEFLPCASSEMLFFPQPVDMPPELCYGIQGKLTLNENAVLPDKWV